MPRSEHQSTWAAYSGARCVALGLPAHDIEQAAEQRATAAMQRYLALGPESAAFYARRCILFRRDQLLHEAFALDLAPQHIPTILDAMAVVGLDQVRSLKPDQGVVFVSLHYSLYSSLLIWWLARATARGLFSSLTVLFRSNAVGQYVLAEQRTAEFESVGVWSRSRVTLLDRTTLGSPAAARALLNRISAGGAVLVLSDAWLLPATGKTLTVTIGSQTIGLPRGVAWLAQTSRCPLVPVYLRPHVETTHAIVFGPPAQLSAQPNALAVAEATIQYLVDQTILADPSPWEGWLRDGLLQILQDEASTSLAAE